MRSALHLLIAVGLGAALLSITYFFSLVMHFPYGIGVLLVVVVLIAYIFLLLRMAGNMFVNEKPVSVGGLLILGLLCGLYVVKVNADVPHYGDWDAWAIWNMHAKFMADGERWTTLFRHLHYGHPDYPLMLPAFTGFFMRGLSLSPESVTYVLCCFTALLIPVALFLYYYERSRIAAVLLFLLLALDPFYLNRGVAMYADTTLAMFFMVALMSARLWRENKWWAIVAGAALGCGLWTKNEGEIFMGLFLLFYARELWRRQLLKSFWAGAALPVFAVLVFKLFYAPPNDMVSHAGDSLLAHFTDIARYKRVALYLGEVVNDKFGYYAVIFFAVLIVAMLRRRWPDKQFFLVLCCFAAFYFAYIFTYMDLQWHMETSAARLLHQLAPAFAFVAAGEIINTRRGGHKALETP